jgi:hypothetical protein
MPLNAPNLSDATGHSATAVMMTHAVPGECNLLRTTGRERIEYTCEQEYLHCDPDGAHHLNVRCFLSFRIRRGRSGRGACDLDSKPVSGYLAELVAPERKFLGLGGKASLRYLTPAACKNRVYSVPRCSRADKRRCA